MPEPGDADESAWRWLIKALVGTMHFGVELNIEKSILQVFFEYTFSN
jgi:hypothetical protein